ncbi:MAG: hypothetical protein DSZ03_08205 [Sulfurimonas sp.]|nr:MAG: hypothetical protein DSZ03_08205 [Sulfurimonas sp.]
MYLHSRRILLQKGISALLLMLFSTRSIAQNFRDTDFWETLKTLQCDLYVVEHSSPTYEQLNALAYLHNVLQQHRVTQTHKRFIRNGVQWLNEAAAAHYKKPYTQLTPQQRQMVLRAIVKETWGKQWVETILTYIYEAMLCDPVYGGNGNESGWRWLHHVPGKPRPSKALV